MDVTNQKAVLAGWCQSAGKLGVLGERGDCKWDSAGIYGVGGEGTGASTRGMREAGKEGSIHRERVMMLKESGTEKKSADHVGGL